MNKSIRFLLSILLISNLLSLSAFADTTATRDRGQWWINLGSGIGGGSDFAGIDSGLVSGNYRITQYQLITARYMSTQEFIGNSRLQDAGLLYGPIAKYKYGYVSAAAGLGWVRYDHYEGGLIFPSVHVSTHNTVGIPAEIQAFVTPTPYVGLGLVVFGNVNSQKSIIGAALAIQLGDLR